ncbi:MAG: right-handed parallel beta-helix repeat-containing protein [Ruminococcaceae bacterium]|nr:right-handed parallel beta-helix repeat-containing protein [Oscillospiraceae bacterium]
MKKIIALILAFCMSFGMIVSVSAAGPFIQRMNLARLIRLMLAPDDNRYEIGEVKDGVLTVYVAVNGKKDADGTKKNPFDSLESARDALRSIDKAKLGGIDVVLTSGEYVLSETFSLTAEDKGAKNCPIRYIGEDGTKIIGGQAIKASDFVPATGSAVQYIPEEAKSVVVQLDLKKYDYTPEDVAKTLNTDAYTKKAIRLFSNGEMQTIARYPNIGEEITILGGDMLDSDGNITTNDGNDPSHPEPIAETYVAYIDEEHIQRALTWHNPDKVYLYGHVDLLWRVDHTYILDINDEKNMIEFFFPGTSSPEAGRRFYLYNAPEELDHPGEYYIDDDAILYYYPTEDFATATLSIPTVDCIINIDGADYTTFENITFETSAKDGIIARANNITIYDCVIRGMIDTGIDILGYNNLISTNHIYNTGATGTVMDGGDTATLTPSNNLFTNNYCHDFGILAGGYNGALEFGGCGNTASHNEIFGSNHLGIHWGGVRNVIEYNYLHDLCLAADDMGAIYGGGFTMIDNTVRYNYIQNIGIPKNDSLASIEGYNYCGAHAVYWDMQNSYNSTYGNIIENIRGMGVVGGNGRNILIEDNLFISCWYAVRLICDGYNNVYYRGESSYSTSLRDYMKTDIWVEAYPEITTLVLNLADTTEDDPLGWATPVNIVIKDNYFYGDRYNTGWRNQVIAFDIESHIYTWNLDTLEDMTEANNTLTVFNSKRNGMPDIKEAIEASYSTTGITYEQFLEMGTDWTPAE